MLFIIFIRFRKKTEIRYGIGPRVLLESCPNGRSAICTVSKANRNWIKKIQGHASKPRSRDGYAVMQRNVIETEMWIVKQHSALNLNTVHLISTQCTESQHSAVDLCVSYFFAENVARGKNCGLGCDTNPRRPDCQIATFFSKFYVGHLKKIRSARMS